MAVTLRLKFIKRFISILGVLEPLSRDMPPWLLSMTIRYLQAAVSDSTSSMNSRCHEGRIEELAVRQLQPYPSSCSRFNVLGTEPCHHFQSVPSLANFFPEADVIKVESLEAI